MLRLLQTERRGRGAFGTPYLDPKLTPFSQNNLNAVERVVQYARSDMIAQEASHEPTDYPLPEKWPQTGTLELDHVVMSYRTGLPPVLKGISIHIQNGEKIGVVGR